MSSDTTPTAVSSFNYRSLSNHSDASRGSSLGSLVTSSTSTGGLLLPSEPDPVTIDGTILQRYPDPVTGNNIDLIYEPITLSLDYASTFVDGFTELLVAGSTNTADRHLYRVPMTAGRTYTFHEGGTRLWYMYERYRLSGNTGEDTPALPPFAQFMYLQDEHRISLYKADDQGRLELITSGCSIPISAAAQARINDSTDTRFTALGGTDWSNLRCENLPTLGWQKVPGNHIDQTVERQHTDPDYEPLDARWRSEAAFSFTLTDGDGNEYTRKPVQEGLAYSTDIAVWDSLVQYYIGSYQLRTVEFTPNESDIYYLGVTRVADTQLTDTQRGGQFCSPTVDYEYTELPADDLPYYVACWFADGGWSGRINNSTGWRNMVQPERYSVAVTSKPTTTTTN